jgi:adenylate kinase family enzyme
VRPINPGAASLAFAPGKGKRVRIAIIGNSGSGKSTLARLLSNGGETPVLDLDTLVWEPDQIAVARDAKFVIDDLERFCRKHPHWIIEGCYADYIQAVLKYRPELVFLEPGREVCLGNCRNRPWEPHKYASKAEQDSKLEYLLHWVADYYVRDGGMSFMAHKALFEEYSGPKRAITDLHTLQGATGGAMGAVRP